jgi:hypothetical protein
MSNNRTQLRQLGYGVDSDGNIVCHREVGRSNEHRYDHERCGVVRIDLERDTKPARDLIEKLIAAIDEPAALTGRDRRGGAVLLFRVISEHSNLPYTAEGGISKLISRGGELLTVTCASLGQTVDLDAYSWIKGRSPLDIRQSDLAVLFADIGQRCVDAAFKLGCADAPTAAERAAAERRAKIAQGLKDGSISPTKYQDEQDERDREFLRKNADVGPFDSLWSTLENMRQRLYARKRSAAVED